MNKTNWLAILVSAIAGVAIGFLWYGLLFLPTWMAGNGITMDGDIMLKNGVPVAVSNLPMILNTIGMICLALLMNFILNKTNHTTLAKGVTMGLLIALIATVNIVLTNVFANNPWSLSAVDASYIIAVLVAMGAILGAWRKK